MLILLTRVDRERSTSTGPVEVPVEARGAPPPQAGSEISARMTATEHAAAAKTTLGIRSYSTFLRHDNEVGWSPDDVRIDVIRVRGGGPCAVRVTHEGEQRSRQGPVDSRAVGLMLKRRSSNQNECLGVSEFMTPS
jgi:hypothetical protein